MLRRTVILLVLVLVPAGTAHAEIRYGGGSFDPAAKDPYKRSVGVAVRALEDGTAITRIDGYVRCKSSYYRVTINDFGGYDGVTLRRNGRGTITLTDKDRGVLRYRWSINATADATGMRGAVRLSGKVKLKGRRTRSCPARGAQPIRLRPYLRAQGGNLTSSVNQRFYGLTAQFIAKGAGPGSGIYGAAIGSSDAQGRMSVRLTLDARCPEGGPDLSPNIAIYRNLPIQADSTFRTTSTYTVNNRAGRYDYSREIIGVLRSDGIEGTSIVNVVITPPTGVPVTCTSGPRAWYALLDG